MSAFAQRALIGSLPRTPFYGGRPPVSLGNFIRRASSSQSPLYSGRPSMGIRHGAPLLLLPPPNPLRWASVGAPKWLVLLAAGALAPEYTKFGGYCVERTPPAWAKPGWLGSCSGQLGTVGPSSRADETSAPTHVTRSLFVGAGVLTGPHGAVRLFVGAAFRRPPRRAEPQRRNAVSQEVLLPTFLSRKVGLLTFLERKVGR